MGFSLLMYVNCILYHFTLLHALACKFYWKQQKQLVKTTSSFSPRNLAALLNRRACCPPQKKLFLSVVKVVSIYKTSPLYTLYIIPTRLTIPLSSLFVYFVYSMVQISASFALFAAEGFTLLNQFYLSSDSSRRASFRAGFLRVSSTAYTFTKPSDSL